MKTFPARAVVFDLDGTLTSVTSPWRMVHEAFGVWEEAVVYHDRFFAGEIDYPTWCRLDSALWRDRNYADVLEILDRIEPTPEAVEILRAVAAHRHPDGSDVAMMILSSGFERIARKVLRKADLPRERVTVVANEIEQTEEGIEGRATVVLDDPEHGKTAHVRRFLKTAGVRPEAAVAVDDRLDDRDLFNDLGAFVHIEKPADLRRVYEFLP